jgi:hypothetical protein
MKELYFWEMQEMSAQFVCHGIFGWGISFLVMGPLVRSTAHTWWLRLPVALTSATFLSIQASHWQRPCKPFHELMA